MYWMLLLFIGFASSNRKSTSDPSICVSRTQNGSPVIKKEYCPVTREDVKLLCLSKELVVLTSLMFAIKPGKSDCMKRVLTKKDEFCCSEESSDVLYDGHCLHDVWNKEDRLHYHQFTNKALGMCSNTSQCVLSSQMFANLQMEIPISKHHSSYIQVQYRCIEASITPVSLCSSGASKDTEVHLKSRFTVVKNSNKTCSCRVTSQGIGNVTVRAVDVRTAHSELILSSDKKRENLSYTSTPLFGFRDLITDKRIELSVKPGSSYNEDNIWFHATASNGKPVSVTCGEKSPQVEVASAGQVLMNTQKTVFWGYWPLIYIASGSLFTIVIVVFIWAGVVIWRNRRRDTSHHPCGHSYLPPSADFKMYPNGHLYATVRDDAPQLLDPRVSRPISRHSMERMRTMPYMRTYGESTSAGNMQAPTLAPTATPNVQERSADVPARLSTAAVSSCDVSELEAFLVCNDQH